MRPIISIHLTSNTILGRSSKVKSLYLPYDRLTINLETHEGAAYCRKTPKHRRKAMRPISILILLLFICGCERKPEITSPVETPKATVSSDLKMLSWNVESDGNSPEVVAKQLIAFADCSIVALQEVRLENESRYTAALGATKKSLISNSGRSDRLMIVYDTSRLDLLSFSEPSEYQEHKLNDGNHRSPLVAVFRDQESGTEFTFLTVHLARGNAKLRAEQAMGLREFARDSGMPMIAAGDFNMDYDFPTAKGNDAFVEMLRDNIWAWVKPDPLIDTNWSDRGGKDNYPDSMLDFCFVANAAREWLIECDVVVREGDFPDDNETSDHRPVKIVVKID